MAGEPSPIGASWVGAESYGGGYRVVAGSWGVERRIAAAGVPSGPPGAPSLTWQQTIQPTGADGALSGESAALRDDGYLRPQYLLHASWLGENPYSGSGSYVRGSWSGELRASPGGFLSELFGDTLVYGSQFLLPAGIDSLDVSGEQFALFPWQYARPKWVVHASWVGKDEYARPVGFVEGKWALPSPALQLALVGWQSSSFGAGNIENMRSYLAASGESQSVVPAPLVINASGGIKPAGFASQAFSNPLVLNIRQYARPLGAVPPGVGAHFLSGGVKYIAPAGMVGAVGRPTVIDPEADQTIRPQGMAAPSVAGQHSVSPRIIYAYSFVGAVGGPTVGRPPAPLGFDNLRMGAPSIADKTKRAHPTAIDAYESGYPVVRDRAQRALVPSIIGGGVFGDVALRNNSRHLLPGGVDASAVSPYLFALNANRHLHPLGFAATQSGSGASVENGARSIFAQSFVALIMGRAGETGVGFPDREIRATGIGAQVNRFGRPWAHGWPSMAPAGISSLVVGTQRIELRRRNVGASGADAQQHGTPVVGLSWRSVKVVDGIPATPLPGTLAVSHGVRAIIAAGDIKVQSTPAPWISRFARTIAPEGVVTLQGRGHNVAGSRELGVIGFDATRWGSRITPEGRTVYPLGIVPVMGTPLVTLRRRYILARGMDQSGMVADGWGMPRLHNMRQYVSLYYFNESGLNPPAWPVWTKIENRNRVILHHSTAPSALPSPQIENGARAVLPLGLPSPDMPAHYKSGQVALRIRSVPLSGIEWAGAGAWSVVYNGARVLFPGGGETARFGIGKVETNRRGIAGSGSGFESSLWGVPFIADAIREITFKTFDLIAPPRIELPRVDLYTRYIDPIPVDHGAVGNAALTIHFNRITTRWTHREAFGEPSLRNVTPEVGTRGRNAEEFGQQSVRLEWRQVNAIGSETLRIGALRIEDSRRAIRPTSWYAGAISDKLVVRDMTNPALIPRYLRPETFPGPPELLSYIPEPNVNGRVLFQDNTGVIASPFGNPIVTANSIRVEPGYFDHLIGDPMVSLRTRRLDVAPWPGDEVFDPSWANVNPMTIWCTDDVTQQAIANHRGRWIPINPVQMHFLMGHPRIELRNRIIRPFTLAQFGDMLVMGAALIRNKRRYLSPVGTQHTRFGFHSIPGYQRTVEHFDGSDTAVLGTPSVARPPYVGPRTVAVSGMAGAIGASRVEHLNRTVRPSAWSSMMMGTWKPGESPYMWQGLRVGPIVPVVAGNLDASRYGLSWVSHKVRELGARGFDAFICTYTPEHFNDRMRVTSPRVRPESLAIVPVTGDTSRVGAPTVRNAIHFIRPDGNSDQHRKGAF